MVAGTVPRTQSVGMRIDRVVAAVAITVLTLSITIFGRMVADHIASNNLSTLAGISLLAPDDRLVTFEDFELGAPGWTNGASDQSSLALGGVLGLFGGTQGEEEVSRVYAMPEDAGYALVSFDIHAIGAWALEDIIIFANGIEVLRQNFTVTPEQLETQRTLVAELPWIHAELEEVGQRSLGARSIAVNMILAGPQAEMRLGFGSTLGADSAAGARWAVDNVQIVTTQTLE